MREHLLSWQWEGYPRFHQNRVNLLLHIVAVPTFIASAIALIASLATMQWVGAVVALLLLAAAFGVQGMGHKREANPAIPFDGPVDTITRIIAEQFITFPRFVLSGGWRSALIAARSAAPGTPRPAS